MSMKSTDHGFTIIEVMLVLAVTGLMLIGIFVGANAQISIQRYHDSVTSLQSDLQNEYSQVLNVANDRSPGKCTTASSSRGADEKCLILGRLIHGNDDTITSTPVVGMSNGQPNDPLTATGWSVSTAPTVGDTDSYTLKWGSTMKVLHSSGYGSAFSALVVVSPVNGTIQTYIDPTNDTRTAEQLLASGPSTQALNLCVMSGFNLFIGNSLAVRVDKGASGTGSIEIPKQSDNVCQGVS